MEFDLSAQTYGASRHTLIGRCDSCGDDICLVLDDGSSLVRQRSLERGERVEMGSGLKLWAVLEGVVALCTSLADGRRQIVCLAAPSDLLCPPLGACGLDIWMEALAPSRICEADLSVRAQSMAGDAILGAELFHIAQTQAARIYAHLVTLGRLDGMERVCLFLADMAWRIGERELAGWRVRLPLAREDIADYLGLNAETVSRLLGRVKKARLVDFHSPTDYLVRDIEALQRRTPIPAPHAPPAFGVDGMEVVP